MTLDELKQANRRLQQENDKLRKEIHRLKARLALYEPADPKDLWATPEIHVREETDSFSPQRKPSVHLKSSPMEKIALFRSLFQ
jgi:hypothetical protein